MNPKKHRVLKYYLDNIKPFLDETPFFKNTLKIIWMKIYKTRLKLNSIWQAIDLNKIYWINHRKILFSLISSELAKQLYKNKIQKTFKYGRKRYNITKFEDKSMYQSFYLHFIRGKKWEETDFYKQMIHRIENGESIWRCSTVEEYGKRCKKLDKLYVNIKNNGLISQKTLKNDSLLKENRILKKADEITILIGPEGEMIHCHSGNHRLTIAKLLDLDKVPVQILYRHKDWLKFRKEVLIYIKKELNGKAYQPLLHPDLSDVPSVWSDQRFEMIRQNLSIKKGTLLDIGAHWGYFCHKFENLGFQCTAMEDSQKNLYFLRKLRRAGNANFRIFNKSIFDSEGYADDMDKLIFDIVLVLDIFNKFRDITEKDLYLKLMKLFKKVRAKEMYLQVPDELKRMQHAQVKDKCGKIDRNYIFQEIIDFIIENSDFNNMDRIGEERSCGIYKLY